MQLNNLYMIQDINLINTLVRIETVRTIYAHKSDLKMELTVVDFFKSQKNIDQNNVDNLIFQSCGQLYQ